MEIVPAHDEVQSFYFNGMELRGLLVHGEPWFIASDLATILEYRMPSDMTRVLADEDKGTHLVRTLGGKQNLSIISEPAFYQLVVQRQSGWIQKKSSREMVKEFQKWVTHDVLPQIRKTGSYGVSQVKELSGAELMAKALVEAQNVLAQKDERIAELAPSATAYGHWKIDGRPMNRRDLCFKLREVYPGMNEKKLREHMLERGELGRRRRTNSKGEDVTDYVPTSKSIDRGYATTYVFDDNWGRPTRGYNWTFTYYEELVKRFSKTLAPAGQQEMLEVA